MLDAVLQGGLDYPSIALHPVIAAAGDQPHPIAVTLDANAKGCFVKPLLPGRNVGCIGRQAEFKRLKPAAKLGILGSFCEFKKKDPIAGTRIWRNLAAEPYCASCMNLVRGNRCFSAV
jgi:hypothetical protein